MNDQQTKLWEVLLFCQFYFNNTDDKQEMVEEIDFHFEHNHPLGFAEMVLHEIMTHCVEGFDEYIETSPLLVEIREYDWVGDETYQVFSKPKVQEATEIFSKDIVELLKLKRKEYLQDLM